MQTWNLPDRHPTSHGPWASECDRAQWVDGATGLDCLILRSHYGSLCGYVGVPTSHPTYGMHYDNIDVCVHGGLTFAAPCRVSEESENHLAQICHIPEPGRDANVWWLGFDCGHGGDLQPALEEHFVRAGYKFPDLGFADVYRDFAYVQQECRYLAAQLAAMGATTL